jgi:hypothetical protein
MSGRPDGKTAEQIRRAYLRGIRFATTYKRCSSCKLDKPRIVKSRGVQLCQDCIARIEKKYGRRVG